MILIGKSEERIRELPDCSIDAIVTDPPYELGFMGKTWDASGIAYSVELWREALRVLKPGGYLLAFGGSRTYHRMACAIEDAGFEIRDQIMWVYSSGFPKSLDVSKAFDKMAGAEREVIGKSSRHGGGVAFAEGHGGFNTEVGSITAPATPEAKQWEGWGTALKPAHEPICVARKPLIGTVAQNVLTHGTGALNVDGCRIPTDEDLNGGAYSPSVDGLSQNDVYGKFQKKPGQFVQPEGRWPSNFIHDGSEEVVGMFPNTESGQPCGIKAGGQGNAFGHFQGGIPVTGFGDSGSAARFYYVAKASRAERDLGLDGPKRTGGGISGTLDGSLLTGSGNERDNQMRNHHPTVKPVALMRYLVRLVTPPNGTVLDLFTGSGTTWCACKVEGFKFIGIEMNPEYAEIAEKRQAAYTGSLFQEVA